MLAYGRYWSALIPLARLAGSLERLFKEFRSRRDFLQTIQRLYY